MKRTYIPPKAWEVSVAPELFILAGSGSDNDHADSKENPLMNEEYDENTSLNPGWTKVKGVWDD